ncbi:Vms1/Ankzf1 family peptidyl-tRNA hydrolase [Halovenus sp. HT40]|uniref:Vms1/Ankzf1 family peptidyl-tRNA hydrolase n=1 Tax=Halovenus sp. HT40 TaxID=3126691 RepID=UPI00300E96EE
MLDDLLGRTELKERIEELEADRESLQAQLDAEQQRRADAVTDRQQAQRRANKLEDRVEELEDRVERLDDADRSQQFRREETLRGRRLVEVLDRLDSVETEPEGALTAYISDEHDLPDKIREAVGERAALVSRAAPCLVVADDAGLIEACLRPPVSPEPFAEWSDGFRIDREWFRPRGRYTLALVRSDLFAMGTYEGDERVGFHGFDSALKSQHSKGGFSQSRFERLRDEQIDDHLDRCRAALEEREADRLYLVGERSVLGEVSDLATVTSAVDATGSPEEALGDAAEQFWRVQLRVL